MCCRRIDTTLGRETVVQCQICGKQREPPVDYTQRQSTLPPTTTKNGSNKTHSDSVRVRRMDLTEKPPYLCLRDIRARMDGLVIFI